MNDGVQSRVSHGAQRMSSTRSQLGRQIACCILGCAAAYGQDSSDLLQRMQSALGGARIFQVRDVDWKVRAKVWDGSGHEAGFAIRRERIILPYCSRKDQEMHISKEQVLHTLFYFDGRSGWGSFADMAGFKDTPVAALGGPELMMVQKEVRGFWLNLWRAQNYEVSVCAPNTLRFVDKEDNSNVTELALAPDTWLPLRSGELCKDAAKAARGNQGSILEWLAVDGIKVPKHTLSYHAGQLVADIETVAVKLNTGMKREDLAQPPDKQ